MSQHQGEGFETLVGDGMELDSSRGTRRRFVRRGLTAVPVIITLRSRSALANGSANASALASPKPGPWPRRRKGW
jgi:hypothetical protein